MMATLEISEQVAGSAFTAGGPTIYVAASDALATSIAAADPTYRCDGTADQVQINAAIDALPAGGGKVMLSEGQFNIAATIDLDQATKSNVTLEGQGQNATILYRSSGNSADLISIDGADRSPNFQTYITLRDFYVAGAGRTGKTINAKWAHQVRLQDIHFYAVLDNVIYTEECWQWYLDRVRFDSCGWESTTKDVIYLFNGASNLCNEWVFTSCRWDTSRYRCIYSDATGAGSDENARITFQGCKWENTVGDMADIAMIAGSLSQCKFLGSYFYHNEAAFFDLDSDSRANNIASCQFFNGSINGGDGDVIFNGEGNSVVDALFETSGASQHINLKASSTKSNVTGCRDIGGSPEIMVLDSGTGNIIHDNPGFTAPGDTVSISKAIDHADITDVDDTGYVDFAETIPAGSIIKAVKLDFTEAFNSDDTTTLKVMIGYVGTLDAFSETGSPGDEAFNTTTDAFWGEGVCQDPVIVTAKTPRVTFTEDNDITHIISGGNAQGGVTITITYMKA